MSLILQIDTSTEAAYVGLAEDGNLLAQLSNPDQKDHAGFLHAAVKQILSEQQISFSALAAIAVTSGPGSYTGLRVGFAAAKGFCFALNIPLISVGTLKMMASGAANTIKPKGSAFFVPMIDARRMEVFTAVYDQSLQEVLPAHPSVLEAGTFDQFLDHENSYFFGSGAVKFQTINQHKNAHFPHELNFFPALATLAFKQYLDKDFTDVVDSEPLYGKEFHSSPDRGNPGLKEL